MGRKFANLHIRTRDRQVVLDALQGLTDQAGKFLAQPILGESNVMEQYLYDKEEGRRPGKTESHVTYALYQGAEWSTVLHPYFEWGTVEPVGELLSAFVTEPVMTIGFFDEDLLEWTIFQDGELRCRKYFHGEWASDEYELEPEIVDFAYLQEVIGIKRAGIDRLFGSESPEQALDRLSSLIGVDLWADSQGIEVDPEWSKPSFKRKL